LARTILHTGLLQNIDLSVRDCQALILAPTRELATQIVKVVVAIGDYLGISTMVRRPHGICLRLCARPVLAVGDSLCSACVWIKLWD
jgi:hypothetical protein